MCSEPLQQVVGIIDLVPALAEDGTGGLKVKVKATEAKMARGEMVRFMAERGVRDAEGLKGFDRLGYRYCQEKSGDKEYVFIKIREQ